MRWSFLLILAVAACGTVSAEDGGPQEPGEPDAASSDGSSSALDAGIDAEVGPADAALPDACPGLVDCQGVCNGTAVEDCAGVCNGTAIEDCTGVCNGSASVGCDGVCASGAQTDLCGTCDADSTNDCVPTYTFDGIWRCPAGETCQDVFDFAFAPGTNVIITISNVTGTSVPRLALFGPGVGLDGNNLLLADRMRDRTCTGPDGSDTVTLTAAGGDYRLAVGRDGLWSGGASGSYHLQVTGSPGVVPKGLTVQDGASELAGAGCIVDSRWACAFGVDCQDVYDMSIPAGGLVEVAVVNITGSSVPRLSLFGPSVPLTGINLLNGTTNDRVCSAPDSPDSAAVVVSTSGIYRLAVGRDWGVSSGPSGNYRLIWSVRGFNGVTYIGRTGADDGPSQHTGRSCP